MWNILNYMTKTDYKNPKELRMSAEAFDWLEEHIPEVKELILAKYAPGRKANTIGGAILVASMLNPKLRNHCWE